jgi:hypothetical protein
MTDRVDILGTLWTHGAALPPVSPPEPSANPRISDIDALVVFQKPAETMEAFATRFRECVRAYKDGYSMDWDGDDPAHVPTPINVFELAEGFLHTTHVPVAVVVVVVADVDADACCDETVYERAHESDDEHAHGPCAKVCRAVRDMFNGPAGSRPVHPSRDAVQENMAAQACAADARVDVDRLVVCPLSNVNNHTTLLNGRNTDLFRGAPAAEGVAASGTSRLVVGAVGAGLFSAARFAAAARTSGLVPRQSDGSLLFSAVLPGAVTPDRVRVATYRRDGRACGLSPESRRLCVPTAFAGRAVLHGQKTDRFMTVTAAPSPVILDVCAEPVPCALCGECRRVTGTTASDPRRVVCSACIRDDATNSNILAELAKGGLRGVQIAHKPLGESYGGWFPDDAGATECRAVDGRFVRTVLSDKFGNGDTVHTWEAYPGVFPEALGIRARTDNAAYAESDTDQLAARAANVLRSSWRDWRLRRHPAAMYPENVSTRRLCADIRAIASLPDSAQQAIADAALDIARPGLRRYIIPIRGTSNSQFGAVVTYDAVANMLVLPETRVLYDVYADNCALLWTLQEAGADLAAMRVLVLRCVGDPPIKKNERDVDASWGAANRAESSPSSPANDAPADGAMDAHMRMLLQFSDVDDDDSTDDATP